MTSMRFRGLRRKSPNTEIRGFFFADGKSNFTKTSNGEMLLILCGVNSLSQVGLCAGLCGKFALQPTFDSFRHDRDVPIAVIIFEDQLRERTRPILAPFLDRRM